MDSSGLLPQFVYMRMFGRNSRHSLSMENNNGIQNEESSLEPRAASLPFSSSTGSRGFHPDSDDRVDRFTSSKNPSPSSSTSRIIPSVPQSLDHEQDEPIPDKIRSHLNQHNRKPKRRRLGMTRLAYPPMTFNPDSDEGSVDLLGRKGRNREINENKSDQDQEDKEDNIMEILSSLSSDKNKKPLKPFDYASMRHKKPNEVDDKQTRTFVWVGKFLWSQMKNVLRTVWKKIERDAFDRDLLGDLIFGPDGKKLVPKTTNDFESIIDKMEKENNHNKLSDY